MSIPDHYSTLGVLPTAEAVVITAAYRALASCYHPDKWKGNAEDANARMSAINEAYRVLRDSRLRAEYDKSRTDSHATFQSQETEQSEQAFGDALGDLEAKWSIASQVFPDLVMHRNSLSRISTSLAFAYVTTLLETKRFGERAQIAADLENQFLIRYFGPTTKILHFAKELIAAGHKDAARTLNKYVDVLGFEVDPDLLIAKVEEHHQISKKRKEEGVTTHFETELMRNGHYLDAFKLATHLGYETNTKGGLFGMQLVISVTRKDGFDRKFHSAQEFVDWAKQDLCRH